MSLTLLDKSIERVRLIDDDEDVRHGYAVHVEDMDIAVADEEGPIHDLCSLLASINKSQDAVICDFNLKIKNYSSINGDEIVSGLYRSNIPALLCTRNEPHLHEAIRRKRRYIPVVLSPKKMTQETIVHAFKTCIEEFKGVFAPPRKPWRTMLRIEGGESTSDGLLKVNAVIPEWDPSTLLNFEWHIGDNEALLLAKRSIESGDILRLYATVNVGADTQDDLFIEDWSLKRKI
jgi:hypothetical protein